MIFSFQCVYQSVRGILVLRPHRRRPKLVLTGFLHCIFFGVARGFSRDKHQVVTYLGWNSWKALVKA